MFAGLLNGLVCSDSSCLDATLMLPTPHSINQMVFTEAKTVTLTLPYQTRSSFDHLQVTLLVSSHPFGVRGFCSFRSFGWFTGSFGENNMVIASAWAVWFTP